MNRIVFNTLRSMWHQLRLAHSDVSYAVRRMNELNRRLA
jgi:hypothetical protein